MARKDKTSIALPEALIKRLDRVAKSAGQSRSEMIRELIEDGLGHQEDMIKVTSDPVLMGAFGKVFSDPGVLRALMSGLRSELNEDQLQLFQKRVEAVQSVEPAKVKSKRKV